MAGGRLPNRQGVGGFAIKPIHSITVIRNALFINLVQAGGGPTDDASRSVLKESRVFRDW
jgi:hypothetical protein